MKHSKREELAAKLKKNMLSKKVDEKEPKDVTDSKVEDAAEPKGQQWP